MLHSYPPSVGQDVAAVLLKPLGGTAKPPSSSGLKTDKEVRTQTHTHTPSTESSGEGSDPARYTHTHVHVHTHTHTYTHTQHREQWRGQ